MRAWFGQRGCALGVALLLCACHGPNSSHPEPGAAGAALAAGSSSRAPTASAPSAVAAASALTGPSSASTASSTPTPDTPLSARELARERAATSIRRGQVFRLNPRDLAHQLKDRPPEYISGFRVVKNSGQALSAELLAELSEWLRFRAGFLQSEDYRHCPQPLMVGVLLEVDAPRPDENTAELALDLGCNTAFITTSDGRNRTAWVSHFDPSRARIISLMRRALPLDSELAGLKESPGNPAPNLDHHD
ncbi:MAG TPA: hypothetical protein VFK05_10990 [Polyangiaceae bacterium]|nr:hypothetical protein [Polyangiaceae bacterium]